MEIEIKEFKNYPKNIKKKISTSINLINFFEYFDDDYFEDWSFLVYPVIVAFEGYIKWLLIKLNIKVDKRINYFNLESNVFKLKKDLNYDKSKSKLINALEDSYNIYIRYRNNLFHYELSNKYDDSFVITNKSKLFKIFDRIYSCFKEV